MGEDIQVLLFSDNPEPNDFNMTKDVEPERRLWIAVLANAVDNITRAKTMAKADETMEWFLSYNNEPGGFYWICSILDISTDYYRKEAWRLYGVRKDQGKRSPRYGPRRGNQFKTLSLVDDAESVV